MKEESLQRIWDWLCDRNFLDDGIPQLENRWAALACDFDSINDQDSETGNSFLHDVVVLHGHADLPQIVGILIEGGADVNIENCQDCTPLHWMFSFDSKIHSGCVALEITKILIENGARAVKPDAVGDNPLHCFLRAARNGTIDDSRSGEKIVEMLLEAGASPDARNNGGETPRIIVSDWENDTYVDGFEVHYGSGGNFGYYQATCYYSLFPKESLRPETEPTTTD